MNFDFSEEQKLLQKTARDFLDEHSGLDVCRGVLESGGTHSDALWKGVAEMGWPGAAVPEEYGGAGFGRRVDRPTTTAIVAAALDAGVTYVDTAEAYPGSEEMLGEALAGRRIGVFLATKFGHPSTTPGVTQSMSRAPVSTSGHRAMGPATIAHAPAPVNAAPNRGSPQPGSGLGVLQGSVRLTPGGDARTSRTWAIATRCAWGPWCRRATRRSSAS